MNRRMMDMLMRRGGGRDGRNPYGSRGGYVVSGRRGIRDGLMMDDMRRYNENPSDYNLADMTRQNREIEHDPYMPRDYARGRGSRRDYARGYDYGTGEPYAGVDDFYERNDMARGGRGGDRSMEDYARGRRDGHYGMNEGRTYYPIEAMGTFNGYYGMGEQDYARGRGRDYGYGYGYDYAGDYGETLTKEELEHWNKKLMKEVEDKDKAFFSRENVMKKAQDMGIKFDKFNEEEFYLTTLLTYTDYCKTLGTANMDTYLRLAKDWLEDKDVSVKGGEKLAVYHDCIVQGDD